MSAPSTPSPSSRPGSPLAETLEGLRVLMADERRAIARLDVTALQALTTRKQTLCAQLAAADPGDGGDDRLRLAVAQIRIALGANAALIAAASEAIAAALGTERDDRYDRTARQSSSTRPLRVVAL